MRSRNQTSGYPEILIACCTGGLVAAGDIWIFNKAFGVCSLSAPLLDFCIVTYCVLLLLKLQRNLAVGTIIAAILFLGGTIGMVAKYALTWSPLSFGDLLLLPDLFSFYGTIPLLSASAALLVYLGLFLGNLRILRRSDIPVVMPALLLAVFLPAKALIPDVAAATTGSTIFSRSDRQEPLYLGYWGMLASSVYRYADQYSEAHRLHEMFKVKPPYPDFTTTHLADAQPRNVYIVLVESLFNPHEIAGVDFDREPLAPPFDSWQRRGGAHAMSPVFGGRSADAEFEILCGLPADGEDSTVLFTRLKAEQIDCLPAKLGRLGWSSVSTVPVPGAFFNAQDAYRRIGFTQSVFIDKLNVSDHDGGMLSAQSLLQQQMQIVERMLTEKRPFLSYVFLTSGHFPYELDTVKRPRVIAVTPSEPMVEAYANSAYYNMLAVGRYIEAVRKLDPTALIVTLGDHPPVIFPNHGTTGYPGPAAYTHQVPLLVFDGLKGELPLTGWVADYHLPEVILDRLTDGRFCATNRCYRSEKYWIRPIGSGMTLVDAASGTLLKCDSNPQECSAAADEVSFWKSRTYDLMGLQ
jgi:hypothetical protein